VILEREKRRKIKEKSKLRYGRKIKIQSAKRERER